MDAQDQGGTHWELAAALDLARAGRTAGDLDMELLGWLRFSEALRNVAGSASAGAIIPMLHQARDERKEDAASTAHLVGMLLDQTEKEQGELGRQAARLGLVEAAEHEHIPPWLEKSILLHLSQAMLLLMGRIVDLEKARVNIDGKLHDLAEDGETTKDMIEYLGERAAHEEPPSWVHPGNEGEL